MEIGERLKKAREERGLTLEAVEEETKIRRKYLQAMEEERFQILPGPIYAKAFLKNYARFLNLNVEEIMESYKNLFSPETPAENTEKAEPEKTPANIRKKPRYWLYPVIAAILAGLVFSFYYGALGTGRYNKTSGEAGRQTTSQPGEQAQTPAGSPQTDVREPQTPEQIPGVSLVLNVKEKRCWMLVVVDGDTVYQGEVTAGQSKSFSGQEKISITLGNAGVVEVVYNGQNVGFLGGDGAVVSREFLAQQR
ncbi:MAG TPA: DUF4115 domain-containing protein [Bacillota bacterium]|nr:DUF4115 domain-containing protein [Bacillota bacterium]